MGRPFGITAMLGCWTQEKGAELYCLEPSGVSYGYWGCAAGKAKSNAKTELEKINIQDKMCELELSWVGEFTNGVHKRVPDNVHEEAERFAKSPWKKTVILMRICLKKEKLLVIQ